MRLRDFMSAGRVFVLVSLITVGGAAAGCGSSDTGSSDSNGNGQSSSEKPAQDKQPGSAKPRSGQDGQAGQGNQSASGKSKLEGGRADADSAIKALRTAGGKVKQGVPYDLEEMTFKGERGWEIKVASGNRAPQEFKIALDGQTVLNRSIHKPDDDVAKAAKASSPLAAAVALSARRIKGDLDEAEIDREEGGIVWTVTFKRGATEHEAYVDAKSGKLIRVKSERD